MIVAGFGCRAGTSLAALEAALALAAGDRRPDLLAAPADRAALVAPLAAKLGLPLFAIATADLQRIETPTQSPVSLARRGVGSVAEAAALAAAGPGAQIVQPRCMSADRFATCALAEGPDA
jgi:cobalt-precorrin 5A hydrolase